MDELTAERYGPTIPWRELRQHPHRPRPTTPAAPDTTAQQNTLNDALPSGHPPPTTPPTRDAHTGRWTAA